jgi:thiol-disulfide isomerase/thioredoxin
MKILPALLLCFALPLPVMAADKAGSATVAKVNLSEFTFGKTISGAEVTAASLKGSPVIVEFWGIHCGPCLAAMPELNAMAKRYESKGLKIIGAHSQSASEEEILKVIKTSKVKFPVTEGAQHPLKFSGIPHSAVFAADGTMLFEGHPADKDFDRAVKDALKTATPQEKTTGSATADKSGPLVAERTWTNADGKPIAASLVKVDAGKGTFRRKDGSTFLYEIAKLSTSDQEVITKARQP